MSHSVWTIALKHTAVYSRDPHVKDASFDTPLEKSKAQLKDRNQGPKRLQNRDRTVTNPDIKTF